MAPFYWKLHSTCFSLVKIKANAQSTFVVEAATLKLGGGLSVQYSENDSHEPVERFKSFITSDVRASS